MERQFFKHTINFLDAQITNYSVSPGALLNVLCAWEIVKLTDKDQQKYKQNKCKGKSVNKIKF